MWLLKDERETLLKYCNHLQNTQEYKRFASLSKRAYNSTRNLIVRGLVHEIIEGGSEPVEFLTASVAKDSINLHNFLTSSENDTERDNITLRLTLEGYDLASKYNGLWYKTGGMWWAEYKEHWLWTIAGIIVSFLLGLLIGKLT